MHIMCIIYTTYIHVPWSSIRQRAGAKCKALNANCRVRGMCCALDVICVNVFNGKCAVHGHSLAPNYAEITILVLAGESKWICALHSQWSTTTTTSYNTEYTVYSGMEQLTEFNKCSPNVYHHPISTEQYCNKSKHCRIQPDNPSLS